MSDYIYKDNYNAFSSTYKESSRELELLIDDKKYFKTEKTKNSFYNICQLCKQKNVVVKYIHNFSTGNILGHLWTKHRIDKDYSEEMNTSSSIIKAIYVITKHRQENLIQCYCSIVQPIDVNNLYNLVKIKNLKFIDNINIKKNVINAVQRLCIEIEYHNSIQEILKNDEFARSSSISTFKSTMDNNLITDLYDNEKSNKMIKEPKVDHYFHEST
ncbi:2170_t:CDS:2 [Cetraspora pellucida]|uniref:2170_t:CDS:1 n=1 Tax=Cetraspora pellucida TaxID=1433469 RepID=A0A9N9IDD5_9GLOM|nr:2170_t:CDS:2 [Cetraspora pellucida]